MDKSSWAIGFTIEIEVCTQPCAAPSSIERLGQHPKPFQYIPMAIVIHGTLTNKCRDLIGLSIYGAFSLGRLSANNGCQVTEELLDTIGKIKGVSNIEPLHDGSFEILVLTERRPVLDDQLSSNFTLDFDYDFLEQNRKCWELTLARVRKVVETGTGIVPMYYRHLLKLSEDVSRSEG